MNCLLLAQAVVTNAVEVAGEVAGAATEIGAFDQWMIYLKQGGNTMWFIGALSVLGIGCALERFWNMRKSRIVPEDLTTNVISLWKAGKFDEVAALCAKDAWSCCQDGISLSGT